MALSVQPYINISGHDLIIFTQSGSTWDGQSNILVSGNSFALPADGLARNIWDDQLKIMVSHSNLNFASGTNAWTLPNGTTGGGNLGRTNVIFTNETNDSYVIEPDTIGIPANQTTALTIPNGFKNIRLGSSTVGPIQILPLPDQIININSDGTINMVSDIGNDLPQVRLNVRNCYPNNMFLAQRACSDAAQQKIDFLVPNIMRSYNVFSCQELFLIRSDQSDISQPFCVPAEQNNVPDTIFFKANGSISTISCTGTSLTNTGCSTCPQANSQVNSQDDRTFLQRWGWLILILVIVGIVIFVIIVMAASRGKSSNKTKQIVVRQV